MAQLHRVEGNNDQMQRDSADSEKSGTKNRDHISILEAQLMKCYPFIADWQISDKKEENKPRDIVPIYFSF